MEIDVTFNNKKNVTITQQTFIKSSIVIIDSLQIITDFQHLNLVLLIGVEKRKVCFKVYFINIGFETSELTAIEVFLVTYKAIPSGLVPV